MSSGAYTFIVFLAVIAAWVATTWIRARYASGRGSDRAEIEALRATLDAQREATQALQERVGVLERIVTDDASRLGAEIDRLRA